MLIYLFALVKHGKVRYGRNIEPAGVLYVPARDIILRTHRNATEEEIKTKRTSEMRRSGLILNDPTVLDAMENSTDKVYLPVKVSADGKITGNSLVNIKQIELLSAHIDKMMQTARTNISQGDAGCRPYYKSERYNACRYCEFHPICSFDEESGDKKRYVGKKSSEDVWVELAENKVC